VTPTKDHPEADPNVQEVGFDVAALSVDGLKRAGVILEGSMVNVERGENEAWKPHSELVGDMRAWDVMDRSYARRLAALHVKATGALKGLRIPRSFPCLGMLRIVSQRRRMVVVQCDGCGEEIGLSTPPDPREEESKPRRRRQRDKSEEWGF
jgi:hypothetical protein